jgi:hypothetical protein
MNEIENYFHKLRFDKNHHLGLGDIRLTIAQQDELVALFKQKLQQHSVMQAEVSDGAQGAAVGNSAVGKGVRVGSEYNYFCVKRMHKEPVCLKQCEWCKKA